MKKVWFAHNYHEKKKKKKKAFKYSEIVSLSKYQQILFQKIISIIAKKKKKTAFKYFWK